MIYCGIASLGHQQPTGQVVAVVCVVDKRSN